MAEPLTSRSGSAQGKAQRSEGNLLPGVSPALKILILLFVCSMLATLSAVIYAYVLMPMDGEREQSAAVVPTPVPPCKQSLLQIGDKQVVVHFLKRQADGAVAVPEGKRGIAYWVEGSMLPYIFAFSPQSSNRSFWKGIQPGQRADIRWGDCSKEEYVVKDVKVGKEAAEAPWQEQTGFSLYLFEGKETDFILTAGYADGPAEIASPPGAGEILTNISILDTKSSADRKHFTLLMAIENAGAEPALLKMEDLSIAPIDGEAKQPLSVVPGLPRLIGVGEKVEVLIVFPHPGVRTAIVKILDAAFEYYLGE